MRFEFGRVRMSSWYQNSSHHHGMMDVKRDPSLLNFLIDYWKIRVDEKMKNMIGLYFTKEFSSEYEPVQLLLGTGIGIVIVVILIKKIIDRGNKK